MNQPASLYIKVCTFSIPIKTTGMLTIKLNAKNLLLTITLILATLTSVTQANAIDAQNWLAANQRIDGSYSDFFSGDAATALTALPQDNKTLTVTYLNTELNDFNSFKTWGDAQTGATAIIAMQQNNFPIDNEEQVITKLLSFRNNATGGFIGWWESDGANFAQVTSSVDTALSLNALRQTNALNATQLNESLNYLLSLQNLDGSFNLTALTESSSFDAFVPSKQSTTALVLQSLQLSGLNEINTPQLTQTLIYLENQVQCNSPISQNTNALALTAQALNTFGKNQQAGYAIYYLEQNQQVDGGFFDPSRGSNTENPIDTSLAAITLANIQSQNPCQTNAVILSIENNSELHARSNGIIIVDLQNGQNTANVTLNVYNNGNLIHTSFNQDMQPNAVLSTGLNVPIEFGQNEITAEIQENSNNQTQTYNVNSIQLYAPLGITNFQLPEITTNLSVTVQNDTLLTLTQLNEPTFGALAGNPIYSPNILTFTANTTNVTITTTLTPNAQEIATYDLTSGSIYTTLYDTPYVIHAQNYLPLNTNFNDPMKACEFFGVAMRISGIQYNASSGILENDLPDHCEAEVEAAARLDILRVGEGLNKSRPNGKWLAGSQRLLTNQAAIWLYRITRIMPTGWGATLYANWTAHNAEINFSQTQDPRAAMFKLQAFYALTTGGITNYTVEPNGDYDICFECTPSARELLQLVYKMLGEQNQALNYQPNWTQQNTTLNAQTQTYTATLTTPVKAKLGWTTTQNQNNNNNPGQNSIRVIIDMPTGQGADLDTQIQGCTTAQQCFQLTGATLTGTTFNIPCPGGVPATQLFVNTVNGYYANFSIDEAYWEFQYNGQSSATGLSCQTVQNGDTIKLHVLSTPQNNQPTAASSSSSSSTSSSNTQSNSNSNTQPNQTKSKLTTDTITPLNTQGFNAPEQTQTTLPNTINEQQPSAPTGLFTAVTNNALPIAILILLVIAGYAVYQRQKK